MKTAGVCISVFIVTAELAGAISLWFVPASLIARALSLALLWVAGSATYTGWQIATGRRVYRGGK